MFRLTSIRSWLWPALFFIWCATAAAATPTATLARTSEWQLLLHSKSDQPQIDHPRFLLSGRSFTPERELQQTLTLYKQDPVQAFCRFPARLTLLARHGLVALAADRYHNCPALQQYMSHVPFDDISLVFASEVLSSASSMMGHIFLTASGKNQRQQAVEHSLAYFTEITTLNPARLIYDGLVGGMPGYFIVRPYQRDQQQYLLSEQRNLWQFSLQSNAGQRELLQLHLWELRDINITYYFQSFNCATLTLELLALLKPAVLADERLFVSPQDVVKAASRHGLIKSTHVQAADQWLAQALRQQLTATQRQQAITYQLQDLQPLDPLTKQYAILLARRHTHSTSSAPNKTTATDGLDFSKYKHPAKTPQDSSLMLNYGQFNNNSLTVFSFLASGHLLTDDNRQYLSESELQIGQLEFSRQHSLQHWRLDELTLYGFKSYTPDNEAFSAWSGELYAGWHRIAAYAYSGQQQMTPAWQQEGIFEISGAVGKNYQLNRDLSVFLLAGPGVASDWPDSKLFMQAKAGLILQMIYATKLTLQYQHHSARLAGQPENGHWSAHLSWFASQNLSIQLGWQQWRLAGYQTEQTMAGLALYF